MITQMLEQPLVYAAKGYYVFPCKPKGKEPLTKHGHKNATTDEKTIRQWWTKYPNANIGLALKPSGLMVVDLDRHPDKPDGVKTFNEIKGKNSFDLMPPRSNTGGNGIQLFFTRPEAALKSGLEGIDIKTDGYVVVPPSIHPDGPAYTWHEGRSLLNCDPVDCPDWLLSAILKEDSTVSDIEWTFLKKYPASSGEAIMQRCTFLKHCAEDAAVLPEPDWYQGTVGVLSYTVEAPEIVHNFSGDHPGYKLDDTNDKIKHWKRDSQGPATCKSIQEKCGDGYCKSCSYNGHIKSPIVLGYANHFSEKSKQIKPFPIDALPDVFGNFAVSTAMAIQCPVDYVACVLLAVVSILMGGKRRIQLEPEWFQQGNLWLAMVGTPSSKKSPALDKALTNIRAIEKRLYSEYQSDLGLYEMQIRYYEVELREWKNNASGNPPTQPSKPILKRLTTSDSTVEALGELLAANSHGLGLVCDELSAWMRSMNQYKGGRGADRSHYLAMWSNAQMTIDRKNKEPIIVTSPYLTMIGGVQPDVLLEMSDCGMEDGMKERFLYSCPLPNMEPPTAGVEIPEALHTALKVSLEQIFQRRTSQNVTITLSKASQNTFLEARQEWHQIMIAEGFPGEMEAYYVKMANYLGRIALVLHEMKRPSDPTDSDVVEGSTMREAKELADYFLNHAAIALGMVRQTREAQQVEKAIRWIKKRDLSVVSPRDFTTYKVAGVLKASEARHLLKTIHDYGYGYWNDETDRLILFQDFVSNSAS